MEEVGEAATDVMTGQNQDGNGQEGLRKELTQIAALCVAWLERWE